MIYDLRFTIGSSRREEALTERGAPPNSAKRLDCVVFSDAFRTTKRMMMIGAPQPRAVLKPPQSKRFAKADALFSLAPGFSPVTRARTNGKPLKRFSASRTPYTGLKAGANERRHFISVKAAERCHGRTV
jgi:hypothetical protein